ncbi:MAG: hypothetical protein SF097_09120 [Acidobacteriota bacterium]|nr:hypothetical protein [Acidobacteriota bacterium]
MRQSGARVVAGIGAGTGVFVCDIDDEQAARYVEEPSSELHLAITAVRDLPTAFRMRAFAAQGIAQPRIFLMPSDCSRDASVVGFIPSNSAAPPAP